MSWSPLDWARSTGIEPGAPGTLPPLGPTPPGGVISIDRTAQLARVQPTAALSEQAERLDTAGKVGQKDGAPCLGLGHRQDAQTQALRRLVVPTRQKASARTGQRGGIGGDGRD
ncbi:MAG: hypothetical protein NTZ81_00350, partial [Actinobacteria bacterium]|nr:hypothetical protein [Actinomycetota bacterium]